MSAAHTQVSEQLPPDCELWGLLAGIPLATFFEQHWQRRALTLVGADRRAFDFLLRIEDLDKALHAAAGNASEFDFYTAGSSVPPATYVGLGNHVRLNRLLGLYAQGGTIHLSNLQKYFSPVRRFCQAVQRQLLVDCEADLWLTRRNRFTPYLHFDRYDIFVLQLHGRKRWRVFETLPITDARTSSALDWSEVGEPLLDVVLAPGDLIYLPPFAPHVVTTTDDEHSLHIGLGLHPITWRQVLEQALELAQRTPNSLSDAVPLDWFWRLRTDPGTALQPLHERTRDTLASLEPESLRAGLVDSLLDDFKEMPDDHLWAEVIMGSEVGPETGVELRPGALAQARPATDGRIELRYQGGGLLAAPAHYLLAMTQIASAESPFRARDLDPGLDLTARVQLVQRCIEAGLCRRAARA